MRDTTVTLRSASGLRIAGKRGSLFLGSAKGRIGAFRSAPFRVRLGPPNRMLVKRLRTLRVRVIASACGGRTTTLVLKGRSG